MNLFSKIIFFFLLILFGQQRPVIIYAVEMIRPIEENSNVTEKESQHKSDLLYSEITRTCNLERDFVNYWERDDRSLAKGADNWLNKLDDLGLAALKKEVNPPSSAKY